MRESLKNIFTNQIILEDKSQFYYTVSPYELTNALGQAVALLQEYTFTRKENESPAFTCRLYKTKEGYWYDIEDESSTPDTSLSRMLKSAIDNKEAKPVLG